MADWLPASSEAGADSPATSLNGHGSLETTLADTTRALEAALAEAAAEAEAFPADAGAEPGGEGTFASEVPAATGAPGEPWPQDAEWTSILPGAAPAQPVVDEPAPTAVPGSTGPVQVVGAADAIAALTDMVPQPPAPPRPPAAPAGTGLGAGPTSASAARLAAPGAQALLSHVSSGTPLKPAVAPQSPAAPSDERAIDSGYLRIGVSGGLRAAVAPAGGDLTLPGSADPTHPGIDQVAAGAPGRHGNPGPGRPAPGPIPPREAPKAAAPPAAPAAPPQPAIRPWQPSDDDILPARSGRRSGRSVKLSPPKVSLPKLSLKRR